MALYEPILPARYLVPLLDVVAQMRESDRRKMPTLAVLDHMDAASSSAVLPLDQVEKAAGVGGRARASLNKFGDPVRR